MFSLSDHPTPGMMGRNQQPSRPDRTFQKSVGFVKHIHLVKPKEGMWREEAEQAKHMISLPGTNGSMLPLSVGGQPEPDSLKASQETGCPLLKYALGFFALLSVYLPVVIKLQRLQQAC